MTQLLHNSDTHRNRGLLLPEVSFLHVIHLAYDEEGHKIFTMTKMRRTVCYHTLVSTVTIQTYDFIPGNAERAMTVTNRRMKELQYHRHSYSKNTWIKKLVFK